MSRNANEGRTGFVSCFGHFQVCPDGCFAAVIRRSSAVGNQNGGTVGLLQNFKGDLPEELSTSSEALEPKNQKIRLIGEPGDCRDNPRTLADVNNGHGWDFVAGQGLYRASFAVDLCRRELFRQNFQEDNLAGQWAV